jgi:hypothetical protein
MLKRVILCVTWEDNLSVIGHLARKNRLQRKSSCGAAFQPCFIILEASNNSISLSLELKYISRLNY